MFFGFPNLCLDLISCGTISVLVTINCSCTATIINWLNLQLIGTLLKYESYRLLTIGLYKSCLSMLLRERFFILSKQIINEFGYMCHRFGYAYVISIQCFVNSDIFFCFSSSLLVSPIRFLFVNKNYYFKIC